MAYSLFVDLDRCIGCYACEVACKQEHDLPVGPRWIRVIQDGPKETPQGLQLDFYPKMCRHCEDPPCAEVCPEKAISRGAHGLVTIDPGLCTGCAVCVEGCPFNLMAFNQETGKASKCDLCAERIGQGLEPSCVTFCPGKALVFSKEPSRDQRMIRLV